MSPPDWVDTGVGIADMSVGDVLLSNACCDDGDDDDDIDDDDVMGVTLPPYCCCADDVKVFVFVKSA